MNADEITAVGAAALSEMIHTRHVSCREVMDAFLDRIDARNGTSNAIVSRRDREVLLAEAGERDAELVADESRGWMHGLPQAIKDLSETRGLVTTMGSPLLRDYVPNHDSLMVSRMRASGCLIIGKTNTPEFGLGSHTFNEVFGATCNAYDETRSVRLGAGESFGEMSLIDKRPRSATVTAVTDVVLAPISQGAFLVLVQDTPYFALEVMQSLSDRLRRANQMQESAG